MKKFFLFTLLAAAALLTGAEIFVGPGKQYTTVKAGINALKEGDTLTIAPGRYFESIHVKKKLKNVTIRAQYPGSVLIHGDKPAPRFTRVPGYRFVYEAEWKENVTAVNEKDSFSIYFPASDVRFLEFNFGYWFKKGNKLYISTTDGRAPVEHDLTVSVLKGNGLKIESPENIVVEGLSFTGFYSHYRIDAWSGINGIQLAMPTKCVIRNCRAFFNANGITFGRGTDSVIENCVAFANGSQSPSSGGNIIGWNGTRNEIRNSLSMYKIFTGGSQGPIGIRFYGIMDSCRIVNCRSFGEDGINIKGSVKGCYAENNYCERHINVADSRNNLHSGLNGYNRKDTTLLQKINKKQWEKHFADPEKHDFRPLSAVTVGMPRTIASGASVLLPSQVYSGLNFTADNVTVSTRGSGKQAVIKGGKISGKNITLEHLEITAPLKITGKNIVVRNCTVKGKLTIAAENVEVAHCRFTQAPDFTSSTGFRHSNLGITNKAGLHDLGNDSFDGFAPGPGRVVRMRSSGAVVGPIVHAVSDTTVDIEWWTSSKTVVSELRYGETPQCKKSAGMPFTGSNWNSVTLTGLKPGVKYYFQVRTRAPLRTIHSNAAGSELAKGLKQPRLATAPSHFTTAAVKNAPRVLTVTGSQIFPVLDRARPGDTVMIKGGVYCETLVLRSSGITLRNVPGEKVYLDGKRTLDSGIIVINKPNTVIDGLFFREFTGSDGGGINITGGSNITVRRCFYDGRSSSYTPVFVKARFTSGLTVEHSVILRGFHGAFFYRCPDLTLRNCVWSNNQINHFTVHNQPKEKVLFSKNIFYDNIPGKILNCLIYVSKPEIFKEESNCCYFRLPLDKRIFISSEGKKYTLPQFAALSKSKTSSFFADPKLPAIPKLLQFKSEKFTEMAHFGKEFPQIECGRVRKVYTPWDFSLFFPASSALRHKIGPDARLFKNGAAN